MVEPDPLTPVECDLRDFAFMPLDVVRLRDSDIASIEDAEAFRAAVMSWCAAWHQSPAASLPDDDAALARLLGYGRDIKTWKRVRAAGALRGYVKCNDGRLYHPVVAEKAREAWDKKKAQRDRTEAARLAKLSQRLSHNERQRQLHCLSQMHPGSVTDNATEPVGNSVTTSATGSKGQGQGQGQGEKERKQAAALVSEAARKANGSQPPGPKRWDDAAIVPCGTENDPQNPDRPLVNGYFLDGTFSDAMDAAGLDPVKSPADWRPVVGWLKDGIEPATIATAIRQRAERAGYVPPQTLAYFDKPVREHHARAAA